MRIDATRLLPCVLVALACASPAGPGSAGPDAVVEVGGHAFHRRVLANGLRAVAVRDAPAPAHD